MLLIKNKTGPIHGTREKETDPSKRYHIEDRFLKNLLQFLKETIVERCFPLFGKLILLFHFGKRIPSEKNIFLPVNNVVFLNRLSHSWSKR